MFDGRLNQIRSGFVYVFFIVFFFRLWFKGKMIRNVLGCESRSWLH